MTRDVPRLVVPSCSDGDQDLLTFQPVTVDHPVSGYQVDVGDGYDDARGSGWVLPTSSTPAITVSTCTT